MSSTVPGTTTEAGVGGASLDLVKRVLRRDETNAMRWLKDQVLIEILRYDREDAESVTASYAGCAASAPS